MPRRITDIPYGLQRRRRTKSRTPASASGRPIGNSYGAAPAGTVQGGSTGQSAVNSPASGGGSTTSSDVRQQQQINATAPPSPSAPAPTVQNTEGLADRRRMGANQEPQTAHSTSSTRGNVLARVMGQVPSYVPQEYVQDIARASLNYGVRPELLAAQLNAESGFAEDVITGARDSGAGAQGIAQIMPETAASWGVDPLDPEAAIDAQGKHMGEYIKKYGSEKLALAAYNAGEGAVQQYGGVPPYDETQNYVETILASAGPSDGQTLQRPPARVPSLIKIGKKAQRKFGVEAREQPYFDPVDPVHTEGSMHYSGNAIDFQGDAAALSALDKWLARKYGSRTAELFYDPGVNISDGQETTPIGGHDDHVHFGLEPSQVGRRARAVYGVGTPVDPATGGPATTASGGVPPAGAPAPTGQAIAGARTAKRARRGIFPAQTARRDISANPLAALSPAPDASLLQSTGPNDLLAALAEAAGQTGRRRRRLPR